MKRLTNFFVIFAYICLPQSNSLAVCIFFSHLYALSGLVSVKGLMHSQCGVVGGSVVGGSVVGGSVVGGSVALP